MYIQRDRFPFWQNRFLSVLISISSLERRRADFKQLLLDQIQEFKHSNFFGNERKSIECLKTLNLLTSEEYKIRRAECYQAEGDHWVVKIPEGYNPNIVDFYVKAFRKLHSVRDCDDLRDSLAKKIDAQQLIKSEIIGKVGVNLLPKIDSANFRCS